ncbi:uncharacterized protein [Diadema setosum]|uniref:uncharacterized protein n=1 Tax=Diadema setosum TaxID=31175 RepID=UPI003B3B1C56
MIKRKTLDAGEAREDRFMLPGVDFKAKLIGIEPVAEARGDKMCLDAMIKLKYLVKTSGEHKPRIIINVSIEGVRILDERTREVLHQHEVHRISFISRDPTDFRAFGYVTGEQGNHKFYGIKTEKQADALVLTLKDLFEVVLDLKKQQIAAQKKQEEITGQSSTPATEAEPKQIASFKNPPPAENGTTQEESEPTYAQVNKPKLTELAAHLNEQTTPGGLLDLEKEVANLQMGIDTMEEFDLNPQTPTSPQPQPDLFASPPTTPSVAATAAAAAAPAPASDLFNLSGPPEPQKPPVTKAVSLDSAFGSSDPFAVQATPTVATNSAAPPASSTPSDDLFKEFKDTFTTPAPQPVNAFQAPMAQPATNPFGAAPAAAAAPFQANFGGMGAAPAPFAGAPAAFGGAPSMFGAPPPAQPAVDPFGGGPVFGDSLLAPDTSANPLNKPKPQKSDPFSDLGALGSSKSDAPKSNKEMFANYKIGKPGEAQPAPEVKLTGGPKRPPPAIPTSPESSTCQASLSPPNTLDLKKLHSEGQDVFTMPSPEGPPPPLPPDTLRTKDHEPDSSLCEEEDANISLPLPSSPPPPLPSYVNIKDVHASNTLAEINLGSDALPPPPPPRSKSSSQLRISVSNPLPVPPRNRNQSSPPHSPHSETASIKSCDARFVSSTPPPNRVSSPSIVSTNSALSTLDELQGEDHSSGVTSNSAPSHSNSMNSLSSVFDSNNVSTDTFDNDSSVPSPAPSPIASSLCHENSAKPIDIMLPKASSASIHNRGPCSTSQDSLYSSVETLSLSSSQTIHPSAKSSHPVHGNHASKVTTASISILSTSAPVSQDSFSKANPRSGRSLSPIVLPKLPVHEDPFADDPFSRHSPSVKKTFVLDSFTNSSVTSTTTTTNVAVTSHSQMSDMWSSHEITSANSDSKFGVVINSDPFAPGGAPVTNGGASQAGNDLFGNSFDTFDFSNPNQ